MKTGNPLRLVPLAAILLVSAGLAGTASATDIWKWDAVVTVPTGIAADDLHLLFDAGGTLTKAVLVAPDSSDIVIAPGSNQLDITLNRKHKEGEVIHMTFATPIKGVSYLSGTWTNGGDSIGVVQPSDIVLTVTENRPDVPGASTGVLVALSLLMLGVGAYAIRRRRAELA